MRTVRLLLFVATLPFALGATTYTNKSFLRVRDTHDFFSPTTFQGSAEKLDGNQHAITLSVTGYYRSGYNHNDIGTYFCLGSERRRTVDPMILAVSSEGSDNTSRHTDYFFSSYLNHAEQSYIGTSGEMLLHPSYTEYGALISLVKPLSGAWNGCSFKIEAPLTHVRTGMNPITRESGDEMASYFAGELADLDSYDYQKRLKYQRISQASPERTHIADIKVSLEKRLVTMSDALVDIGATLLVPIAPAAKPRHLFAPQVGTGHNTGLGCYAHAEQVFMQENGLSVRGYAHAQYQYLLSTMQQRTLGIYDYVSNRTVVGASYRHLVEGYGREAIPGANILTRWMDVTPGNQFTGTVGIRCKNDIVQCDISYTLFTRQKESVIVSKTNSWPNNTYGAALAQMTNATDAQHGLVIGDDQDTFGAFIQEQGNTLDQLYDSQGLENDETPRHYVTTDACSSPADLTHTLNASIGCSLDKVTLSFGDQSWSSATSLTLGGSYEFTGTQGNNGMRSWSAWTKVSVSF